MFQVLHVLLPFDQMLLDARIKVLETLLELFGHVLHVGHDGRPTLLLQMLLEHHVDALLRLLVARFVHLVGDARAFHHRVVGRRKLLTLSDDLFEVDF